MDTVDEFLGTPNGECGNDNFAPFGNSVFDHDFEFAVVDGIFFVFAVAVGAFDEQNIGRINKGRVAENRPIWTPNIT